MYTHQQKIPTSELIPIASSPMEGPTPQLSAPSSDLDVSITLRKGKRFFTDHPISHFVSYVHLTPSLRRFALSLSFVSIPRSYEEAILVPAWKQAKDEKMVALFLEELGSWSLHPKILWVVDGSIP